MNLATDFHPNSDELRRKFPQLLKMEQPIEKGEYEEGGGKGWEMTLRLRIDILWSMGNPMPKLTLTPSRGLRIWTRNTNKQYILQVEGDCTYQGKRVCSGSIVKTYFNDKVRWR
jgi:hypothetical protein